MNYTYHCYDLFFDRYIKDVFFRLTECLLYFILDEDLTLRGRGSGQTSFYLFIIELEGEVMYQISRLNKRTT